MNFFRLRDYKLLSPIETSSIESSFPSPRRETGKSKPNVDRSVQVGVQCVAALAALELLQSPVRLLHPPATGTPLRGVGWIHGLDADTAFHGSILQLTPDCRVDK